MEALKAVEVSSPIFPKKKIAALSLIPKSPIEIGSIDFTIKVAAIASRVGKTGIDSNAEAQIQN